MSYVIRDSTDTLADVTMASLHAERTRVTALFAFSCTLVLALAFLLALGDVPALVRTAAASNRSLPPATAPVREPRQTHSLAIEHVSREPSARARARPKRRRITPPPDIATLLSRGIAP